MFRTPEINLNSILQVKPSTWDTTNYSGKNHVTIEISSTSPEYDEIKEALLLYGITGTISKIERVQHPFAYGRFLIRKEQLEKRIHITTKRKFYSVYKHETEECLEYNMDKRRVGTLSDNFSKSVSSHICIIISQTLVHSGNSRDSEEYPEYIIHFL